MAKQNTKINCVYFSLMIPLALCVIGFVECTPFDHKHKHAIKTIKLDDGDVIDCVDIYKQPAFDHPLLQNHTIQMRPSIGLERNTRDNKEGEELFEYWLKNGEHCPEGTIPILRTPQGQNNFPQRVVPPILIPNGTGGYVTNGPEAPGHEYAQISLLATHGNYFGARAYHNVWCPHTEVNEISISQVWVIGGPVRDGPQNELNSIEAGWMVGLLHDYQFPRFFVYWTSDNYEKTGCYNLDCPGFVQTTTRLVLGTRLIPFSTLNRQQYDIKIEIVKDKEKGIWWLLFQGNPIGYWPDTIFTHMKDGATMVNWGGEIFNTKQQGHHTSTQMGSGFYPEEGFGKASFIKNINYVDYFSTSKDPEDVNPYATQASCYNIGVSKDSNYGTYIYFGGPGFSPICP